MLPDKPQARICSTLISNIRGGLMSPAAITTRSQTDCAALMEICWPTMARASVENALPRVRSVASGYCLMSFFITLQRLDKCVQASCQYSGVMVCGLL